MICLHHLRRRPIKIFIPTKGRVENQYTWDQLPAHWKRHATLVCPISERDEHIAYGRNVAPHPNNVTGIACVRQFILERLATEKFFMIDDDHRTFRRVEEGSTKLALATEEDYDWMFENLLAWLDDCPHVGVGARGGNLHQPVPYVENTRINNFHGFRKSVLLKHGIRFDDMLLMEDLDVILTLLELGYSNRLMTEMCWNHARGSNASGGCSEYRDHEMQREAAYRLKERHPNYVTVVDKMKTKYSWSTMPGRTDVRVQWQKCWKDAQRALQEEKRKKSAGRMSALQTVENEWLVDRFFRR